MKGLVLSVLLLFVFSYARAEQPPQPPSSAESKPVFGIVANRYVSSGKDIASYCSVSGGPTLPVSSILPVVGMKNCERTYSTPELFYEVVYRGESYFVAASDIKIVDDGADVLKNRTVDQVASHRATALSFSKKMWLQEVTKSLKRLEATKKYGVTIVKARVYDVSEYTDGTGFSISFYNPTKKTIKYITTNYIGYNAVGDPVRDYRSRSNALTLRGVGPIGPEERATYTQEYAWMTDVVDSFKISSVKIQYMDGSTKVLKDPKKAWLDEETVQTLDDFATESSEKRETAPASELADAAPAAAPAAR